MSTRDASARDASGVWARAMLLLCCLGVLVGCPVLDVSQPIALDPEDAWGTLETRSLRHAAECWNQAFGTQLVVEGEDTVSQRVSVHYSDFICLYAGARADPPPFSEVNVCPLDYFVGDRHVIAEKLFDVLLHELGHVLNIRTHGEAPSSVMTGESSETWWADRGPTRFSPEDRQLFEEANPEHDEVVSCTEVIIDRFTGYPNCRCIEPAAHARCLTAQSTQLDRSPTVVTGSTAGGGDEFEGTIDCGRSRALAGPQLYFRVTLEADRAYRVELTPPGWDAVLVVFPAGSCDPADINRECASVVSDSGRRISDSGGPGGPEEVLITPQTTRDFIIAVESLSEFQRGSFYLTVSW